ncbi:protease SohB [Arenicella sp. 4NH20-0111]|uniref:protease SohB n=1 Tax=Arenicella sp. 4NH20-0111 TaxID=3127648 RepID=UPI0031088CE6
MSEFFFSYGLFIAKVITGLIALVFAVAIVGSSRKKEDGSKLKVTNLNEKLSELTDAVKVALMDKKELKKELKLEQKEAAKLAKQSKKTGAKEKRKPKLFVLNFDGDVRASEVETLREEITALLSVAQPQDEVLLRLDNSGGMVHEHGLAASQLQRIKDANLTFTVVIDRVAASGGYMMACVADKIIAAPFAIIGSIGVVAQLPNFHRLLDKAGIDFEQHTAGEFKRTVTMFGKNGEKEREKLRTELQETHNLFQDFVSENRSKLDVDKVSTGEHWYGKQALALNLVDELKTSDEFLTSSVDVYDIYELTMEVKQSLQDKFLGGLFSSIDRIKNRLNDEQSAARY